MAVAEVFDFFFSSSIFTEILRDQHLCIPPSARTYPYLESEEIEEKHHALRNPNRAIKYVGFDGEQGLSGKAAPKTAYLSARYETRREDADFSVMDYLLYNTELIPFTDIDRKIIDSSTLERAV